MNIAIPNGHNPLDLPGPGPQRRPTQAEFARHQYDILYEPKLQEWMQSTRFRGRQVHQDTHDLLQHHWPNHEGMTFVVVPKTDTPELVGRASLKQLKRLYPYMELSLSEAIRL